MAAMQLTRTHRVLIGVVVAGALVIAAIGFAGSYAAVRELAEQKGFGDFSLVFPIGIDAGICVLLALDLLLTWMRIPFPLLRQTAWLLTFATIAFNGAAAWPDPLGVGMHAVIPILFVVAVEAARHAVGRIADITADKHMEGVRLTRWLLSPVPTFKLWRRMKLWELRSYEQVIKLEQDRLIYQARLQARFGRAWRRKAPIEALMPLRLAKYGVPLADTAPAGLAAAGIDPVLLPPAPVADRPELTVGAEQAREHEVRSDHPAHPSATAAADAAEAAAEQAPMPVPAPQQAEQVEQAVHSSPWFTAPQALQEPYQGTYDPSGYVEDFEPVPVPVTAGPGGRTRPLGTGPDPQAQPQPHPQPPNEYGEQEYAAYDDALPEQEPRQRSGGTGPEPGPGFAAQDIEFAEAAYPAFLDYVDEYQDYPSADSLDIVLADRHGVRHPRSAALLRQLLPGFQKRHRAELEAEHIA